MQSKLPPSSQRSTPTAILHSTRERARARANYNHNSRHTRIRGFASCSLVVLPLAFIGTAVSPSVNTVAVSLAVLPFYRRVIVSRQSTESVSGRCKVHCDSAAAAASNNQRTSDICVATRVLTTGPAEHAPAIALVVLEAAFIHTAVGHDAHAPAMALAVAPLAVVDISVGLHEGATAVRGFGGFELILRQQPRTIIINKNDLARDSRQRDTRVRLCFCRSSANFWWLFGRGPEPAASVKGTGPSIVYHH